MYYLIGFQTAFTRDVVKAKAKEATKLGKEKGYPLFFTTEMEE
jgi:ATP-dependent Clp protease adaptor protein ClpS